MLLFNNTHHILQFFVTWLQLPEFFVFPLKIKVTGLRSHLDCWIQTPLKEKRNVFWKLSTKWPTVLLNLNEYLVGHGLAIKQNKNIFCGTLRRFWKWGFERKNVIVWKHQALWLVAWSWMVLHGPFIIIVGNYIAKIFLPSENLESNPSVRSII